MSNSNLSSRFKIGDTIAVSVLDGEIGTVVLVYQDKDTVFGKLRWRYEIELHQGQTIRLAGKYLLKRADLLIYKE